MVGGGDLQNIVLPFWFEDYFWFLQSIISSYFSDAYNIDENSYFLLLQTLIYYFQKYKLLAKRTFVGRNDKNL